MTIKWVKKPGGIIKFCTGTNGGLYATSDDHRFRVWVRRVISGYRGEHAYKYLISVTDMLTGRDIPLLPRHNPSHPGDTGVPVSFQTAAAVVEKYAGRHRLRSAAHGRLTRKT